MWITGDDTTYVNLLPKIWNSNGQAESQHFKSVSLTQTQYCKGLHKSNANNISSIKRSSAILTI